MVHGQIYSYLISKGKRKKRYKGRCILTREVQEQAENEKLRTALKQQTALLDEARAQVLRLASRSPFQIVCLLGSLTIKSERSSELGMQEQQTERSLVCEGFILLVETQDSPYSYALSLSLTLLLSAQN